MGLNELPSEVLSCVLGHLIPRPSENPTIFGLDEKHTDWSEIVAVTCVNRRLNTHAVPLVYRHIFMATSSVVERMNRSGRYLTQLSRTFLENPEKLEFVRSVRLEDFHDFEFAFEIWSPKCRDSAKSMIDAAFADHPLEHTKWTKACLEGGSYDYILPLLLAHLPHLRYLALSGFRPLFWQNIDLIARRLTSTAATKHRPLSELKTVMVGECNFNEYDDCPLSKNIESLAVVASWQAVEVIHSCFMVDYDGDEMSPIAPSGADLINLKPGSARFTTACLKQHSRLSAEHLRAFLSAARALETFEYQIGTMWTGYTITSAGIAKALAPHARSLKNITIWYDLSAGVYENDGILVDSSISFRAFSILETLTIPLQMFFGIDGHSRNPNPGLAKSAVVAHVIGSLPSSLRELTIAFEPGSRPGSMNHVFMALINSKEQFFPSLKCLTASTPFFFGSPFEILRLAHREAADREIEVRVSEYSFDDDSPGGIRPGVNITFPPQNWDDA